nr:hypothetical protein [uncultured Lichenicoccus sp.]
MVTLRPGRYVVPLLLAGVFASLCGVAAAQTVPKTNGMPPSGVVKPPRRVDPKMSRPAPAIPAKSMPVIHPDTTTKDGTVVVPR